MSMPAIERVIPLVGHLPASIRDALARRLRELAGLSLIALSGVACGRADDVVGAGSQSQPRDLARDPQHPRLSRRDRRRSVDADPRSRRDHADPSRRGVGLAHADPSHLRPRSLAPRLLDPLHRDRGRLCQLLAAWRFMAAADRTWRRGRRRAGARAGGGVRPGRVHLSPRARRDSLRGDVRGVPVRQRLGFAPARRRRADADRGRRHAVRGRARSQLGLARMGVSRHHECEGAARLADRRRPTVRWSQARRNRARSRSNGRSPVSAAVRRHRLRREAHEDYEDEAEEDDEEEEAPAARAPRKKAAPKPPARNPPTSSNCHRSRC